MIPNGWKKAPLDQVATVQTGIAKGRKHFQKPISVPYLRVANVQDGYLDLTVVKNMTIDKKDLERYSLQDGDVLLTEGGDYDKLGRGTVWRGQIQPCLHQNHVFVVRPDKSLIIPEYLSYLTGSSYGKLFFLRCSKQSTNLASINANQLKGFPALLPPIGEQKAIIQIVSTWDRAIEKTDQLIAAKNRLKNGLMQRLLFGRARLKRNKSIKMIEGKWFSLPSDWKTTRMGAVAEEIGKKNALVDDFPVLSCTKHKGLINSLEYFDKQIFSKNTITYKIVAKGQFAYATNHIEEGSIGYQDLYPVALVSPMYTVFEADLNKINHGYLYKLLKTETYRRIFAIHTNASVDRRGSLRWKEFAKLPIPLPDLSEQQEINEVSEAFQKEIELLERKLYLLRKQKRSLMQKLLTGKIRMTTE